MNVTRSTRRRLACRPASCSASRRLFGSLLATLNHVMVGDTLWLQRYASIKRLPPARPHPHHHAARVAHTSLFAAEDFTAMHAHRLWLDQLIIDWAAAIREEDLDHLLDYRNSKGPNRREFFSLLIRFFNHQTHRCSFLALKAEKWSLTLAIRNHHGAGSVTYC